MGVADASVSAGDSRLELLSRWVFDDLGFAGSLIAPASADASFRRYFRLSRGADSYIIMDAPPDKEDSAPFVKVAQLLAALDLNVPLILARDLERGFLLLSDLGSRQYLDELPAPGAADRLYSDALAAVLRMQTAPAQTCEDLPPYDRALLLREMQLLPEWFLRCHLGLSIDAASHAMLETLFTSLSDAALEQPVAFVHRDYHSRNLLLTAQDNPGILDFQDAVRGPVTYDLASLLKDCYIAWPPARVKAWALEYRDGLLRAGLQMQANEKTFIRWFDLMGLQRHIKVLGIFARLFYRDGKSQYLKDLPRVLDYVRETAAMYEETSVFADYIAKVIDPEFAAAQQRALR
jgi:aminoglycoside/choline kinase family phosphotransferase